VGRAGRRQPQGPAAVCAPAARSRSSPPVVRRRLKPWLKSWPGACQVVARPRRDASAPAALDFVLAPPREAAILAPPREALALLGRDLGEVDAWVSVLLRPARRARVARGAPATAGAPSALEVEYVLGEPHAFSLVSLTHVEVRRRSALRALHARAGCAAARGPAAGCRRRAARADVLHRRGRCSRRTGRSGSCAWSLSPGRRSRAAGARAPPGAPPRRACPHAARRTALRPSLAAHAGTRARAQAALGVPAHLLHAALQIRGPGPAAALADRPPAAAPRGGARLPGRLGARLPGRRRLF